MEVVRSSAPWSRMPGFWGEPGRLVEPPGMKMVRLVADNEMMRNWIPSKPQRAGIILVSWEATL